MQLAFSGMGGKFMRSEKAQAGLLLDRDRVAMARYQPVCHFYNPGQLRDGHRIFSYRGD